MVLHQKQLKIRYTKLFNKLKKAIKEIKVNKTNPIPIKTINYVK